jgi:hypothetical protein
LRVEILFGFELKRGVPFEFIKILLAGSDILLYFNERLVGIGRGLDFGRGGVELDNGFVDVVELDLG